MVLFDRLASESHVLGVLAMNGNVERRGGVGQAFARSSTRVLAWRLCVTDLLTWLSRRVGPDCSL